jgi:hypothetical protein
VKYGTAQPARPATPKPGEGGSEASRRRLLLFTIDDVKRELRGDTLGCYC